MLHLFSICFSRPFLAFLIPLVCASVPDQQIEMAEKSAVEMTKINHLKVSALFVRQISIISSRHVS